MAAAEVSRLTMPKLRSERKTNTPAQVKSRAIVSKGMLYSALQERDKEVEVAGVAQAVVEVVIQECSRMECLEVVVVMALRGKQLH